MASPAQITANQANAQLSTGPRTPEGKALAAANSRKDGLTAQTLVITHDQQPAFDQFRRDLRHDTRPEGALEDEFFQRLLTYGWNLRRARALESTLLAETDPIHDEESANKLHRIARYRRELERSYDRALAQLRHLQTQRAVLLQQDAHVVNAVTRIAPVADLTRITNRTDPFVGHFNPFQYRNPQIFLSRAAARREHRANEAGEQNEPNTPIDPELAAVVASPKLSENDKRAFIDLYTTTPPPAPLVFNPSSKTGNPVK